MPAEIINSGRRPSSGTTTTITAHSYWSGDRASSWTVRCEDHSHEATFYNRTEAFDHARYPASFCPTCTGPRTREEAGRNRQTRRAATRGQRLGINRRFGIEFEFTGIPRATVERYVNDSGLRAAGWRVKSDPSVRAQGGGGSNEVISPPLQGVEGLAQVRQLCEWLEANGAIVNRSCGTHVHFEVADIGIQGVKNFAKAYVANADLIDWLVSPSRRAVQNPQYCARPSTHIMQQIEGMNGPSDCYYINRYQTVNVAAFGRHGTVEVRQHQGTFSFDKIASWMKLGMGMLDTVAETGGTFNAQSGLRSLMRKAQVQDDAAAFLLGRAVQFGAPAELVAA